jgi:hypothetical protein
MRRVENGNQDDDRWVLHMFSGRILKEELSVTRGRRVNQVWSDSKSLRESVS